MSAKKAELLEEAGEEMMRCANCGVAGGDGVKLKNCTACYLVRYCSVKCQRDHRPQHKRACKKRAAELEDELLFKQPESSHLGDCPICLLPIPINDTSLNGCTRYSCCSKVVCDGCLYTNLLREEEAMLPPSCPFCRVLVPTTDKETNLNEKKRVEANDPGALDNEGVCCLLAGNYSAAVGYWEKAAALGYMESHFRLSNIYGDGDAGVCAEIIDTKKSEYHAKQAAIGGHLGARYNLGLMENQKGNVERAVKHFIIAVNLGHDLSVQALKLCYEGGVVSKEDFVAALHAYQATVDATKSPQRDAAAARKM
jgi:tetratricopeptide (TPR) repeat protein